MRRVQKNTMREVEPHHLGEEVGMVHLGKPGRVTVSSEACGGVTGCLRKENEVSEWKLQREFENETS